MAIKYVQVVSLSSCNSLSILIYLGGAVEGVCTISLDIPSLSWCEPSPLALESNLKTLFISWCECICLVFSVMYADK